MESAADWFDILLRLVVLVSLIAGAHRSWRNLGTPFRYQGRTYRRDRGGAIRSRWGMPIRDPELRAQLEQACSAAP